MSPATRSQFALYILIAAALAVLPVVMRIIAPHAPFIADDAFYYLVVAHNMADLSGSVFYHGVLTNGYHPLWLGVLSLVVLVFGSSLKLVVGLGILLSVCTVFTALYYLRPKTVLGALNIAILVWIPFRATSAFTGMESGLVLFLGTWGLCALFLAKEKTPATFSAGSALLILATAARIDFAVIALPALLLAPCRSRRLRLAWLAVYLVLGAAYAGVNHLFFHMSLPISGTIKSLGGLQINHRFIDTNLLVSGPKDLLISLVTISPITLVFFVVTLTPALVLYFFLYRTHSRFEPPILWLGVACVVGTILYLLKILFSSSWITWGWYGYISGFLLLATLALASAFVHISDRRDLVIRITRIVVPLSAVILLPFYLAANAKIERQDGFAELNYRFVQSHRKLLDSSNIAMGDRAGSMAYFSGRSNVFQLEGLVMDRVYFEQLKQPEELTPYLCRKGVDILVDYEPPLGDYASHRIDAMRPALTQYRGGYVTVNRSQQIFTFKNEQVFPRTRLDRDTVLYGWKLNCGVHSARPARRRS